jgi:hypothetical protein
MSLAELIAKVRRGEADKEDWLFIAHPVESLSLHTDADIGPVHFDENADSEIIPPDFLKRGLHLSIDLQSFEDCIAWADRLNGSESHAAVLDILKYHLRFDSFPDRLGAPDPPPVEEIRRRLDREFYDRLGPENISNRCRHDGCLRGCVRFSVLCKVHHFESIKKRPCPFND